ncbi:MAG: DNA replication and repair protein RecF, partial [Bdellovibrionales bacterium]|nr:DNA replication and repair protein RecF [Bdellovibrionales bacterium]
MFIKNVRLNQFRNFEKVETNFSPQINFFLGQNGQGKTNLLESLYLLIKGNSFRYSNKNSFINYNIQNDLTENTFIRSDFFEDNLSYKLQLSFLEKSKSLTINQKKIAAAKIQKKFQCILFSPESLSFIKESSEFRRELIDDFLISVHSKNVDIIHDFKKILRTRNKLLKENKEGKINSKNFPILLETINNLFFKKAVELTLARISGIKEIQSLINDHMQYISNSNVDILVDYVASDESILNFTDAKIEKKLSERHKVLSSAEIASGTSLIGPHKHEIIFLYDQKDSRYFCSQGQQRAIILSFKMAQIVYHRKTHGWYPVLMLDDVLSELDAEKKMRLISFLEKINTQIFITATDFDKESDFRSSDHKIINISHGKIL